MYTSKVKHTIIKGNVYYLNFRVGSHTNVRISLGIDSRIQARLIIAHITPILFNLKSLGQFMYTPPLQEKINALVAVLTMKIKEHAQILLYPTSPRTMDAKSDYKSTLDWIAEDIAEDEGGSVGDVELEMPEMFSETEQEHSASVLSGGTGFYEIDKHLSMIGIEEYDPFYSNAKRALEYVYHHARKAYKEIGVFEYEEAETTLSRLQQYSDKLNESNPCTNQNMIPVKKEEPVNVNLLSEWIDRFIEMKRSHKENPWSGKVEKNNTRLFEALVAVIEDIPVTDINGRILDEAFTVLRDMPVGNKKPYNNMSICERVEIARDGETEADNIIKPKTLREYKKLLQSLFKFIMFKRVVVTSPTENMFFEIGKSAKRGAFSDDQRDEMIKYCLSQPETEAYKKWGVLLMAYTGMRNTEVMQLSKSCIKKSKGIHYIMVDNKGNRALKTESAIRQVPLHADLMSFGFLEYVKGCKERLFPDTTSKSLTRFYQIIKRDLGFEDTNEYGSDIVLYSLRHWFNTHLRSHSIDIAIIQQLMVSLRQRSSTSIFCSDLIRVTHPSGLNYVKSRAT
ncbi:tyrosine-type recombinase/integrase [Psychromonas antarctica]|uniref:tyrosine-type recombinase/integrase n=1 Tax=Psychromonas antarctica TaxID=67573 RepID=UPI001EE7DF65|nr:tyrosine-type recombinase/integrase [Psychromonas antarctica]MCG6199795.1 tyrosine-type recombinase/integrase [Psychromonas antarctica]